MKLRSRRLDDPFDGLTAEDVRRIRGAAAASVTPGLEGLVIGDCADYVEVRGADGVTIQIGEPETPKRKRGRR